MISQCPPLTLSSGVYPVRRATHADLPVLSELIAASVRALHVGVHSADEIEASVGTAFGTDPALVDDGTLFVAEWPMGPERTAADSWPHAVVAMGGWSRRLKRGGARTERDADDPGALLDPAVDAAKIRAFYVHPAYARRGISAALLAYCEAEIVRAGFGAGVLVGTISAIPFYERAGYAVTGERFPWPVAGGLSVPVIEMRKTLRSCGPLSLNGTAGARTPSPLAVTVAPVDASCLRCVSLPRGTFSIRAAQHGSDVPLLEELILVSVRALHADMHTPEQIEASLGHTFGIDRRLIDDQTLFVVAEEPGGRIAAMGGWSKRAKRAGARAEGDGDGDELLDVLSEPARIRAFYVHPALARQGVASALLAFCEDEIRRAGFCAATLLSALPAVPFYLKHGYESVGALSEWPLPGGQAVQVQEMRKDLVP